MLGASAALLLLLRAGFCFAFDGAHFLEHARHLSGGDDRLAWREAGGALIGDGLFEIADDLGLVGVLAESGFGA